MPVAGTTLYLMKQLFYILRYFAKDKEPERGLSENLHHPLDGWVVGQVN